MHDSDDLIAAIFPHNSSRRERQKNLDIRVIVGNPPWSAGQRSSADDNPNVSYPALEARVAETYAARSTATLKNSLYNTYKMAIRWASDRIGDQGVVAYRHERLLDRRQRRFRYPCVPRGGVQHYSRHKLAGGPTDTR